MKVETKEQLYAARDKWLSAHNALYSEVERLSNSIDRSIASKLPLDAERIAAAIKHILEDDAQ